MLLHFFIGHNSERSQMSNFDFTAIPDYSKEDYLPGGVADSLHFVSRFLVTFLPPNLRGFVDLVALTHYTYRQHSSLSEDYSIRQQMQKNDILYVFWAGFNRDGKLVISSSGSESMNIHSNKELEEVFLSTQRVQEKLKLLMPNIKELDSVMFKRL